MKADWSISFQRRRGAAVGLLVLTVLAAGIMAGCGSEPKLYHVSGKVTFNGKPVPAGIVYFEADTARGNDAPGGYASIKDGWFDTRHSGKGVIGGPYRVTIQGGDGVPTRVGGEQKYLGIPLFEIYTTTVDLPQEHTARDFDIPAASARRRAQR